MNPVNPKEIEELLEQKMDELKALCEELDAPMFCATASTENVLACGRALVAGGQRHSIFLLMYTIVSAYQREGDDFLLKVAEDIMKKLTFKEGAVH